MAPPVFPALVGIVWPVKRYPVWNTETFRSIAGKRTTLGRQPYPFYRYEVGYDILRDDIAHNEWQDLISFFNIANGSANLFQFNDVYDQSVTTAGFGTGDGTTTAFQLTRPITGNSFSWVDPVFAPVTFTIFDNGTPKTVNVDYTMGSTGIVTFTVAPLAGHALTWTGTYNWMCRFDEDVAPFEKFMKTFWELKSLKFSTELF